MRGRAWSSVVVLAAVLLAACESAPSDPDGGTEPSDAAMADGGEADGGEADGGAADGGAADAATDCVACGADEACVRGVCIATCGGDVSGFEDALGAGLTPVASFCRPASAYAVHASGADLQVYDLAATTDGLRTTFALSRWPLDPSAPAPAAVAVAEATHDVASADELVFPSGFLALDATGARALFGYTTTGAGSPGEVFAADVAGGSVVAVDAPGNFDAAWIDSTRFIVNGMGLVDVALGQGLYVGDLGAAPRAVHVATNMGAYSGSVAASEAFVLAGGVTDGTFESHAYFVPAARFDTAFADEVAIDVMADSAVSEALDPEGAALASTFSTVRTRVVTTPYGGPLTSYAVAATDTAITLSDPRVLALGPTFTDAIAAGTGQLLLVHAGGLLLVQE